MNGGKYLIFSVSTEFYAIPIIIVREIIRYEKITVLRDSLEFLKGVINLRGKIIPVIDMRVKFGMEQKEYDDRTVFIIIDINGQSEVFNIGIAVDRVSEVVDIGQNEIEKSPEIGFKMKSQYLDGIAKVGNDVIMLINIEKILSNEEVIQLKAANE